MAPSRTSRTDRVRFRGGRGGVGKGALPNLLPAAGFGSAASYFPRYRAASGARDARKKRLHAADSLIPSLLSLLLRPPRRFWDTGLLSSWGSGWGRADRFQSPGTWYRTFQVSKEETIDPTSASTVSHTVSPVVEGTDVWSHWRHHHLAQKKYPGKAT